MVVDRHLRAVHLRPARPDRLRRGRGHATRNAARLATGPGSLAGRQAPRIPDSLARTHRGLGLGTRLHPRQSEVPAESAPTPRHRKAKGVSSAGCLPAPSDRNGAERCRDACARGEIRVGRRLRSRPCARVGACTRSLRGRRLCPQAVAGGSAGRVEIVALAWKGGSAISIGGVAAAAAGGAGAGGGRARAVPTRLQPEPTRGSVASV